MMIEMMAGTPADLDRVETRGRKPKIKPDGIVKMSFELTPDAVEVLAHVKAIARSVEFPVPSYSETVRAALRSYEERYTAEVQAAVAHLGTLVSPAVRAAADALPAPGYVNVPTDEKTLEAIEVFRTAYARCDVLFVNHGQLVARVLRDAADSL